MEQQDRESMNFEEIVQRAVNAKAKTGLRSSTMVWDLDIRCPKDHCPCNSTASKVQTQETTAKDFFRPKEPKSKDTKAVRADAVELLEQNKKDKKDWRNKKRKFRERKEPKKTLATGNNVINASKKN